MERRIDAASLEALVQAIFERAGSASAEAAILARHLVLANLVGHDSHGIIRLSDYLPWLAQGKVRANRAARIVHETPVSVLVDGDLGFGQVIGEQAQNLAAAKALATGIAIMGLRNTGHVGRVGHFAERAAAAGLVSLHFVNTTGFGVLVAPVGGREARLSANPLAIGMPRGTDPPLVLDISTASIAEGKIKVARNAKQPLPEGCVTDADGNPTTDPRAFYGPPRGAILPMGGHKGYALSVMIEALAGALSGAGCSGDTPERKAALVNNMTSILIRPDVLGAGKTLAGELQALETWLRSATPSAPGAEILLPGERERRTRTDRERHGIPIDATTFAELRDAAEHHGNGPAFAALARGTP
jgi:hydroxycarboxylate dehydrogenase B